MTALDKNRYIESHCHIRANTVLLNGALVHERQGTDFSTFAKSTYQAFNTDYPKFFKMDNLSKLTFLAAELLLKREDTSEVERNIALVLSNRASSLDTDRKHQKSIANEASYFPSPAVFVYTLPNICMGEISIRHQLYSENGFFVFEKFNAPHLFDYAESLMVDGKADKVLCGWEDFDHEKYEAFLYVVGKSGTFTHSIEEITRLYQKR